jgi:hypothetical protein
MALAKTVTHIIQNTSIGASSYYDSTSYVTLTDGIALAFDVSMLSSSSAEAGVRADVIASPDGTTWNTQVYDQFTVTFSSGTTEIYSQTFDVNPAPKYIKLRLTNLSTGSIASACNVDSIVQSA